MKHLLLSFLSLTLIGLPTVVSATPTSGDLIKASGPSVYYFGADQKRYVFPTEKTYKSWYVDFSNVRIVSDTELASYPLGGNTTYRPGTRLVKVTTDPKVYAIAQNGLLRWVQTEDIARTLFGVAWAQQVDDIPDAFFVNYRLGSPITQPSAFSPSQEQQAVQSINQDRGLIPLSSTSTPAVPIVTTPTIPTVTSTVSALNYTATIALTTTTPRSGDLVGVQVTITPASGLESILITLDGVQKKICTFHPCATEFMIPVVDSRTTYVVGTDVRWIGGQRYTSTSTLTLSTNGSNGITLTMRPEVRSRTGREIVVLMDTSFSAYTIDIYLDGNNIRACMDAQECRSLETETSATGTTHRVYAVITDRNGLTRRSETRSYTVVDNERPNLRITLGKTLIHPGETVDVTVNATDDDTVQSTEIWVDNQRVKQCLTSSCTVVAGPWNAARSVYFLGRALDSHNLEGYTTSTPLSVQ